MRQQFQITEFRDEMCDVSVTFCGPNPGQREISSFDALTIPCNDYGIKDKYQNKT